MRAVGCFENYDALVSEQREREALLFDPHAISVCAGCGVTRLGCRLQKDRYAGRVLVRFFGQVFHSADTGNVLVDTVYKQKYI